jgi:hypothetical protein
VILTLVHGTWASDAKWIKSDSVFARALTEALRGAEVQIAPFTWNGSNSHRDRCRAAVDLRTHIKNCASRYPLQDHFIISHSHGGNVALYALRDDTVANYVRGIVCLSTPFIHCRPRQLGPMGWTPIYGLWVASAMWLSFFGVHKLFPSLTGVKGFLLVWLIWHVLAGAGETLCESLLRRFKQRTAGTRGSQGAEESLTDSFRFPALKPDSLLVLRTAGDEASAGLATSHFLSLVLSALSRVVGSIARFGLWLATLPEILAEGWLMIPLLLFISSVVMLATLPPDSLFKYLAIIVGSASMACLFPMVPTSAGLAIAVAASVPCIVLIFLLTLISAPFGMDTAALSYQYEITAEGTPPGRSTTIELLGGPTTGLQHSLLHESEVAAKEIAAWINAGRGM